MEMLLAILLWLGCITAPNTYYQSQIDSFESQNQAAIDGVMASPTQQAYVRYFKMLWMRQSAVA